MGKSVYSLILSSEIIQVIDEMAVKQGYSRSGLINQILAQHASLSTPEEELREIISIVLHTMDETGLRGSISSGGTLTLRTAIRFKYNPSLSYMLELYEGGEDLGELRVALRSQSDELVLYMQMFFKLFGKLEKEYLPTPPENEYHIYEEKRFLRMLRRPKQLFTPEQMGQAISCYVGLVDQCVKTFFNNLHDANTAVKATEACYVIGLNNLQGAIEF